MCYSAMVKRDLEYLGRRYGAIVTREQIDDYLRASASDRKRYPPLEPRIFPGHYAPVIFLRDGKRVIELMRYGAYPATLIENPRKYTTFNARRDNLTSPFWSNAFMRHHGFAVLERFYEWVAVKDLLKAGVVSLEQVKADFTQQTEERKARVLAAGKKYKPTPTELKDPRFRQIIIEFKPTDGEDLLAPVIFSEQTLNDGRHDKGFAIVTDDPPPEISEAGHDRCPVYLSDEGVDEWMDLKGKRVHDLTATLDHKRRITFTHALPQVMAHA